MPCDHETVGLCGRTKVQSITRAWCAGHRYAQHTNVPTPTLNGCPPARLTPARGNTRQGPANGHISLQRKW
eukprot:scaffold180860_cov33-Tisochrysis_lutea.AAC.2